MRVADEGARYPITIDPVYSTATWDVTGASGAGFGLSVSAAGDVNGDGYDDVLVGAPYYRFLAGRVYVYHGSATGLSTVASTTIDGVPNTFFGNAVAGTGDMDGDGYDDVVVGAQYYASTYGQVTFYPGSATGVVSTATLTVTGNRAYYLGNHVSAAGDVNGDGYADAVVGAYYANSGQGQATVYYGSATGPSASSSTTWNGAAGEHLGCFLDGDIDVDADGYDDVIVGSYDSLYTGQAYVFHGSALGIGATATTTLSSGKANDLFGGRVAGIGDVDGDGYDDVAVGAPYDSARTGAVYVYPGSASGVSTTAAIQYAGDSPDSLYGWGLSRAGDVNLDGYDDLLVGAQGWDTSTGRAYLYLGGASGLDSTSDSLLEGPAALSRFGVSVSEAGDIDGDGDPDLIVGAYGYQSQDGRAFVYASCPDRDGDGSCAPDDCDDADATVLPGAADPVGDGVDQDCDGSDGADTGDTGGADTGESGATDTGRDTSASVDTGETGDVPTDSADSGPCDTSSACDTADTASGGPSTGGDTDTDTDATVDTGATDTDVTVDTGAADTDVTVDTAPTDTDVTVDTAPTDTDMTVDTGAADTDVDTAGFSETDDTAVHDTGSASDPASCGCRSGATGPTLGLALGALALLRRRRAPRA